MNTFFGETVKRRNISLGGNAHSSVTHATLLDQARAHRAQRESQRRQDQSALAIQSFYRGRYCAKKSKARWQAEFDRGLPLLDAARCLAIFGNGDLNRLDRLVNDIRKEGPYLC
jgi:ubiquitin-protein ligase E3 C